MLESFEAFVLAVELGSFAAAAKHLRVDPSTISKKIASLEEHYGVVLMKRTTRRQDLTAAGQIVYTEASNVVRRINHLEARFRIEPPANNVFTIATSPAFCQLRLTRLLPLFHHLHPEVQFRLVVHEDPFMDESFDVAIWVTGGVEHAPHAQKLGDVRYYLCASPDYLKRNGRPNHPADLSRFACMTDESFAPLKQWVFDQTLPRTVVSPHGPLQTDDASARLFATLEGMGIGALPNCMIAELVRRGELEVLFPNMPLNVGNIWGSTAAHKNSSGRAEAFLNLAMVELRRQERLILNQDQGETFKLT